MAGRGWNEIAAFEVLGALNKFAFGLLSRCLICERKLGCCSLLSCLQHLFEQSSISFNSKCVKMNDRVPLFR